MEAHALSSRALAGRLQDGWWVMWWRRPGLLLVAIAALASIACTSGDVEPEGYRVVGHIDFSESYTPAFEIPETATAGVPVEITVWTLGSGCHDGGDTELAASGRAAVVTPYDIHSGHGICTDILKRFEHTTIVVFPNPGTAEIVLRYSTTSGWPSEHNIDGRKVYTVEVSPAG